jgi:DNA-binding NtrC family response regulator
LLNSGSEIDARHLALTASIADVSPVKGGEEQPKAVVREGQTLEEIERQTLVEALQRTGWNVSGAARLLGVSRDTLRYRIDKFGLSEDN